MGEQEVVRSLLAVLLLLVCCSGLAQAEIFKFTFRTVPDGVDVYQANIYVGKSGEELNLDLSTGEQASNQFRFVKDGYQETQVWVNVNQLRRAKVYPPDGPPITLPATSWWIRLQGQPVALAGVSALFCGGMWLLGLRIKKTRAEILRSKTLTRLSEDAGEGGSLLMECVGGYRLVNELGRGGMSVVYRGIPEVSLSETEDVAVKVMSRDLLTEPQHVERFRREIGLSKNLVHPNIVRLLDFGEFEGRIYLVQEILKGETLREELESDGLSPERAWDYLRPIMSAVHYAHTKTIVHRDLKPENIMLSEGQVKVGDFGLAKAADSKNLTRTGTALGTPSYMAPEQIQEQTIDPRTDQYALGIMTYELLTGSVPFEADDAVKVIFMHLMETATPLIEVKPELGQDISDVVSKMLEKEPENRFATIQEASEAIESALFSRVTS